jgi:NAD(P)-dependent dehydrogenase (short-subunit alcohol dehydrogenase family)
VPARSDRAGATAARPRCASPRKARRSSRWTARRAGGDVEALLAQRRKRIPLATEGDGRDTANAALFLASDEARFVTGTEIVVDGGMTVRCD